MKIGILTLHRANNYGAALQCYALQETLRSLGHEVYIIDYRQPDTEESYKIFSWIRLRESLGSIRSLIKTLLYIPYNVIQQKWFNRFRKKYLHCTSSFCSVQEMPQSFDVYMIGSDQLWSIQCMGGHLEPVYFGQFPHPQNSRIMGYAISGNIGSLETIGIKQLSRFLPSFDCISLRETVICEWLTKHMNVSVRQDVDPTLLCEVEKWDKLAGNKPPLKDKYLLTYFLLPEQKVYAKKWAEQNQLRLVEAGKIAFSPEKFLSLVKYADYIVGGSFHIAVFSILFHKRFSIIKKNSDFDVRSFCLLKNLGLEEHFIGIEELAGVDVHKPIDFSVTEQKLQSLRQQSMEYLRSI